MPTQRQINDFKRKARAAGYSEIQIANEISRKIKAEAKTRVSQPQTRQRSSISDPEAPREGFLKRTVRGLIEPGRDYLKFIGEAGAQTIRAIGDKDIDFRGGKKIAEREEKIKELNRQNTELIKKARATKDKKEKDRLLNQSRELSKRADELAEGFKRVGDLKPTFFEEEEKISDRKQILKTGIKRTAGGASYVVPGGRTVKAAAGLGAISGALFGLSQGDDIDPVDIIAGAIGGGIGGAAVPLVGRGWGKVTRRLNKIKAGRVQKLSKEAAQRINKASPSAWQKGLEQHGFDLNSLTEKYFSKGVTSKKLNLSGKGGASYDDLLGKISERGRGGILKTEIEAAEAAISKALKNVNKNTKFTIDEIVKALTKEKNQLLKLTGNETNAAALKEFIRGLQAKYGKGITPKRLLDLKRIADSQFGHAVTNENTGSAIAQAQKMVANAARSKLKKLLPTVKNALDNETEVYTIRPVLSRARAILNTQGSTIRVGSLGGKSVLELLNPFTLGDAYLSDPKRASKFLSAAAREGAEEVVEDAGELFSRAFFAQFPGRTVGADLGTRDEEPVDADQGLDGEQEEVGFDDGQKHDLSLTQPKTNVFGGRSKQEIVEMAFRAGANTKQIDEIEKIYDRLVPEAEDDATLELSDTAIKKVSEVEGAIYDTKGLYEAIKTSEDVGVLKGIKAKNPFDESAVSLQAEIDRVRQAVGKALEGGVLRKEDEEKYKKILPKITDKKSVALNKLKQLHQKLNEDLKTYVELQKKYGKGRGAENILKGDITGLE